MFELLCTYTTDDFRYSRAITDKPTTIPLNIELHQEYELYYFIRGEAVTYFIEGSNYSIEPGGLLIIANRESHRPLFQFDSIYEKAVIHFSENLVRPLQSDNFDLLHLFMQTRANSSRYVPPAVTAQIKFAEKLQLIEQHIQEPAPESQARIKLIFFDLLISLNTVWREDTAADTKTVNSNQRVQAILDYINGHLYQDISLSKLEEIFFISKYHLCHTFKRFTGFSVLEYINKKRIVHALDMLHQNMPPTEVCYRVGYQNYSSFYRAFKKVTGYAPRDVQS